METRLITCLTLGLSVIIVWMIIDRRLGKKVQDFAVVYILMFFINSFFWLMDAIERRVRNIQAKHRLKRIMKNEALQIRLRIADVSTLDDYEELDTDIKVFEAKFSGVSGRNSLAQELAKALSEKAKESLYLAFQ